MVTIQEYKDKAIQRIELLIAKSGLESFELSEAVREMAKQNNLKNWAEKMSTWRQSILETDSLDGVDVYERGYSALINNLMEKKHEDWKKESEDYWQKSKKWWEDYEKKEQANKEWLRKYLANELDWQKDQKKKDEENRKKLEESENNQENNEKKRDEEWKKKFIGDIEMDLIKKSISQEILSKRLGVSDWKEKITGAADFYEALSRRSDLWDIISELKSDSDSEFTCAGCGERKKEYYNYPLEGGKKYCSKKCWDKGEKNNDSPTNNGGKFGHFSISDFFALMKKLNVKEIRFDFATNQVMLKFNDGESKKLNEVNSGLTSSQKQKLESELKSSQQPITFDQVSSEFNKGKSDNKNGNVGIIAAIIVVGIILAVVIGVVISKNKKREY